MSAPREVPRRRKGFNYRRIVLTTAGIVGWTCLFTGALYATGRLDKLWLKLPVDDRDPRRIAELSARADRREKFLNTFASLNIPSSATYREREIKDKEANTEGMRRLFSSEGFDEKVKPGLYGDVIVSRSEELEAAAPAPKAMVATTATAKEAAEPPKGV